MKNNTPKAHTAPKLYQVQLSICMGMEAPIPVLPKMRSYVFANIGRPTTKRLARKRQLELCHLNHGYQFSIVESKGGNDGN